MQTVRKYNGNMPYLRHIQEFLYMTPHFKAEICGFGYRKSNVKVKSEDKVCTHFSKTCFYHFDVIQ